MCPTLFRNQNLMKFFKETKTKFEIFIKIINVFFFLGRIKNVYNLNINLVKMDLGGVLDYDSKRF